MFNAGSVFTRLSDRTKQNYFELGGGNIQLKQSSKRNQLKSLPIWQARLEASRRVLCARGNASLFWMNSATDDVYKEMVVWWTVEWTPLSLSLTCGGRSENGKMCSEKNTHGSEHKYIPSIYVGFA